MKKVNWYRVFKTIACIIAWFAALAFVASVAMSLARLYA